MIKLQQGENRMVIPRQDLPEPLPAALAVRFVNGATNKTIWSKVVDSSALIDWVDLVVTVVGGNANPLNGEIALQSPRDTGQWTVTLFGGSSYSEAPVELTQLREEICVF